MISHSMIKVCYCLRWSKDWAHQQSLRGINKEEFINCKVEDKIGEDVNQTSSFVGHACFKNIFYIAVIKSYIQVGL